MKWIPFVVCADLLLFTRAVVAESLSPSELRIRCQACDPPFDAANCPSGTIFVSATDSAASFSSIQAALNSLPDDNSTQTILIGGGQYEEQLIITHQGPLHMLGQNGAGCTERATIHWSMGRNVTAPAPTDPITGETTSIHNIDTAVVLIAPLVEHKNVSQPPPGPADHRGRRRATVLTAPTETENHKRNGSSDFRMYEIDVDQRFGAHGVALALAVVNSKASFYGSGIFGFQDTVFIGHSASALFLKSTIKGTVDFLYGYGTAVFFDCTLASRSAVGSSGSITAWKKSKATDNDLNGAYIANSRLVRADDIDPAFNITGRVSLGRPWGNQARTVYLNTYMDSHIIPIGFTPWSSEHPNLGTLFYAEYNSTGPGATMTARSAFPPGTPFNTSVTDVKQMEHLLDWNEARNITFPVVFHRDIGWVDRDYALEFGRGLPDVDLATKGTTRT